MARGLLDVQHVLAAALLGVHKPVRGAKTTIRMGKHRIDLLGKMNVKEEKRILSYCDGDVFGDDCVMWKGALGSGKKGAKHGRVRYRKSMVLAHRLLYHNYVAPITVEKPWVLHHCDSDGQCVALKHLYAGTPKQNTADMEAHENVTHRYTGKLSDDEVRAIRKRARDGGMSQRTIAAEFGVSQGTVSDIHTRKRWKNVE